MFSLLTLDAARDAVARQFEYGEPHEGAPTRTPAGTPTGPTRAAAPAHRSAGRSNPFAALLHRTGDVLVRATWSPTR